MPKRIGNTLIPRNPVARAMATRCAGAHQPSRTGQRQRHKLNVGYELENWRDDVDFEQHYLQEQEQRKEGSDKGPSDVWPTLLLLVTQTQRQWTTVT